jgi:RHS repeat-associated protein
VASANLAGNLGYQSEFTESSSGRVNMAARWYNPNTGQFDNHDSVRNSPTPDSANANAYAYANGNPLTNIDPSGHYAIDPDEGEGPLPKGSRPNHNPPKHRGNGYFERDQRQQANGSSSPPDTARQNSSDCGSDWRCNLALKNKLDDAAARLQQQQSMALANAAHCVSQACYEQSMAGSAWLDNGDGTYVTTDGYNLVTYTSAFQDLHYVDAC